MSCSRWADDTQKSKVATLAGHMDFAPGRDVHPAAIGFFGAGPAGWLWRTAFALWAAAAGLMLLGYGTAAADPASFAPLAWFGLAFVAGCVALAAWAAAAVLAVAGRGAMAKPVLGLGAAVFALAGVMAALSLAQTGSKGLVGTALVACAVGLAASVKALMPARSA